MCNKTTLKLLSLIFAVGMTVDAFAVSASTSLGVSASVNNNCTIATTPIGFGAYDPIVANASSALNSAGTVTITCTKKAVATIGLDNGVNAVAGARNLLGATNGDNLGYSIYQPPDTATGTACTYTGTTWGTSGVNLFSPPFAPSKAARTYNVCGSVTAAQDVSADSYSDTVNATVNFT